jgi:hypothetical protein
MRTLERTISWRRNLQHSSNDYNTSVTWTRSLNWRYAISMQESCACRARPWTIK